MDNYSFLQQKSLPLTLKRLAPEEACVAFLYSEEQMSVFHVFESINLRHSIEAEIRSHLAHILAHDIHARVGWIPCAEASLRAQVYGDFNKQFGFVAALTEAA